MGKEKLEQRELIKNLTHGKLVHGKLEPGKLIPGEKPRAQGEKGIHQLLTDAGYRVALSNLKDLDNC